MKNYYLYSLLTFTIHAGCTHSQPLDMKGRGSNQGNNKQLYKCTLEQQTQHLQADSSRKPNTSLSAEEEQKRAVAFCKLMKKFVEALAFGRSSQALIEQYVLDQFPELLDSSPTKSQPVDTGPIALIDPEKHIDIAMAMYQYMKEMVQRIGYVKVSVPSVRDKYKYCTRNTYTNTNQYIEQLIDELLCKFPQLFLTDVNGDGGIAFFEAIRRGGKSVTLRFLNLLRTIDQKTAGKINLLTKVLNHQNCNRYTPLMFLAFSERENVVLMQTMLRLGAKLDVENNSNRTVLHVCVQENNPKLLTAIFQHIFASKVKGEQEKKEEALNLICQPDEKGVTPLMLAAERDDYLPGLKILAPLFFKCSSRYINDHILDIAKKAKASQNVSYLEKFHKKCLLKDKEAVEGAKLKEAVEAARLQELEAARFQEAERLRIKKEARIRQEEARMEEEARIAALDPTEQAHMRKEQERKRQMQEKARFEKLKKDSIKKPLW